MESGMTVHEWAGLDEMRLADERHAIQVVLIDADSVNVPHLEALDQIQHRWAVPVIMMSGEENSELGIDLVKRGAIDFLVKPFCQDKLNHALAEALSIANYRGNERLRQVRAGSVWNMLSPREQRVCQLAIAGYSNKQIGELLHVEPDTIKKHRSHIMEKAEIDDLPSLMRLFDKTPWLEMRVGW